jgi:type I restriction enzyme S subunit
VSKVPFDKPARFAPTTIRSNSVKIISFENVSLPRSNVCANVWSICTFKNAPSRARRIAKVGDTLISTVRTYLKAIDFIDQVKSSYIYSTGFAILQPKEFIYPEFLGYFVRSDAFTEQVTVNSKGMSYPAINSTDIGRLTVVHCKTVEQKQIVEYIESNNAKIATAISLKEQEIEKLKEYKATLINSAVTGKIKVC